LLKKVGADAFAMSMSGEVVNVKDLLDLKEIALAGLGVKAESK